MFFQDFSFKVITHTSYSKGRIIIFIIKVIKNKTIYKTPFFIIINFFINIVLFFFIWIILNIFIPKYISLFINIDIVISLFISIYIYIKGVFRVFRGFYGRFRFCGRYWFLVKLLLLQLSLLRSALVGFLLRFSLARSSPLYPVFRTLSAVLSSFTGIVIPFLRRFEIRLRHFKEGFNHRIFAMHIFSF